jgi:hypothetical protein
VEFDKQLNDARDTLNDVKSLYQAHYKALELNEDAPPPAAILKEATRYIDAILAIEKLLSRLDGVQPMGKHWEEIDFDEARDEVLRRIAVYRDRS